MQKLKGKWLVGCSGGPDSMALVKMCLDCGTDIALCHVNYHHQVQAEEEEAYVLSFAKKHSLDCYVKNEPFVYTGNFEAAAREWRYTYFAKIVKEHGYEGVLVAHQEDDLLETYFMQEEKNIIPDTYGLKEESTVHGIRVKRPLLSCTKKDLEEYCEKNGMRYYMDETNNDVSYARNRIRKEVVSKLDENGRAMVRKEIRYRNAELQERRCRVNAEIKHGQVKLTVYRMLEEEARITLLRELLAKSCMEKETTAFLKETDIVLMKKDDFVIPVQKKQLVQENGFFFVHQPYLSYTFEIENREALMACKGERFCVEKGMQGIYALTVKEGDFPLTIRNVKDGDEIFMRYGHKPVHRFFIDRKIRIYYHRPGCS